MKKKRKLLQLQEACYMIKILQEMCINNSCQIEKQITLEKPKVKMLKLVMPGFEGYFN